MARTPTPERVPHMPDRLTDDPDDEPRDPSPWRAVPIVLVTLGAIFAIPPLCVVTYIIFFSRVGNQP